MSDTTGRLLLAEKDFVDVVDEEGVVIGSAPKHWDNDQLAAGLKKKSGRSTSSSSGSGAPSTAPSERKVGEEPGGNAATAEWVAYAKEKGAKPEDLVDGDGKDLSRDALRAKYGTPAS